MFVEEKVEELKFSERWTKQGLVAGERGQGLMRSVALVGSELKDLILSIKKTEIRHISSLCCCLRMSHSTRNVGCGMFGDWVG